MTESLNLAQLLPRQADRLGDRPALRYKRHGLFHDLTWQRYRAKAQALAAALVDVGVEPGDRVALVGENSVDWLMADLGILTAGAVTVPPHAPLTARQIHFQLARRRGRLGVRLQRGAARQAARRPRRAARAARHRRLRPAPPRRTDARLASDGLPRSAAGWRCRALRGELERRRAALDRRRPGHGDVHLRHDRQPQGGDADARQPALQRRRQPATSSRTGPTTWS